MHFAIVEDLVMDQKHLIRLIQENLEKYHEKRILTALKTEKTFWHTSAPAFIMLFLWISCWTGPV